MGRVKGWRETLKGGGSTTLQVPLENTEYGVKWKLSLLTGLFQIFETVKTNVLSFYIVDLRLCLILVFHIMLFFDVEQPQD